MGQIPVQKSHWCAKGCLFQIIGAVIVIISEGNYRLAQLKLLRELIIVTMQ